MRKVRSEEGRYGKQKNKDAEENKKKNKVDRNGRKMQMKSENQIHIMHSPCY